MIRDEKREGKERKKQNIDNHRSFLYIVRDLFKSSTEVVRHSLITEALLNYIDFLITSSSGPSSSLSKFKVSWPVFVVCLVIA